MKMMLFVAALAMATSIAAPVSAQGMSDEDREQAYYACRAEYVARGMGNDDAANAYCYNKYYNENPWSPPPRDVCTSISDNCIRVE